MARRILAISPHADDIELGCAGYLAKQIAEGAEVFSVLVLAKSEQMNHAGFIPWSTRANEFVESMRVMGVDKHSIHLMKDVDFDLLTHPKQKVISYFDQVISDFAPDTVLLPVPSFHQDHQYVYDCAMSACRPTRSASPIRQVLAYEYPAAGWGPSSAFDTSRGAMYVDITGPFYTVKRKALACHQSQHYNRAGSLISLEAIEIMAKMRGLESNCEHAELLYLLRAKI